MRLEQIVRMQEMEKIKRKKIELAGAHRALEVYGLNEGIDNHITTKDWIHILYPKYVIPYNLYGFIWPILYGSWAASYIIWPIFVVSQKNILSVF